MLARRGVASLMHLRDNNSSALVRDLDSPSLYCVAVLRFAVGTYCYRVAISVAKGNAIRVAISSVGDTEDYHDATQHNTVAEKQQLPGRQCVDSLLYMPHCVLLLILSWLSQPLTP